MLMIIVLSPGVSTSTSPGRRIPSSSPSSLFGVSARSWISWDPSSVSAVRSGVDVIGPSPRSRRVLELHRDAPDAVVLPQRVPLPVVGHQDPCQVRMVAEDDAEQVVGLALHRVGTGV